MRKGLLGTAGLALIAVFLTGCGTSETPAPSASSPPAASPSGASPSGASPSGASTAKRIRVDGPVGSDGLKIQVLGADGTIEIVRVEDLPR